MVQSHNTMQSMKNEAKQCTKTSRSIIKFKKKRTAKQTDF